MSKNAIIILPEIYGINQFIKDVSADFRHHGFDVIQLPIFEQASFTYEDTQAAYTYFMQNIGFDIYQEINLTINQLKTNYDHVFVLGLSVGATIAWRCCENSVCDGIIACYGSRIRDYTDLTPACPTLLLFAQEDAFDIDELIFQLQEKPYLSIVKYQAKHGFIDHYSNHHDSQILVEVQKLITQFLQPKRL